VATCNCLVASVNTFISSVSLPSVVASFAKTCVKLNELLEIDPDPVNDPEEKSEDVILVPLNDQYKVVPSATLVVVTVVIRVVPSFNACPTALVCIL